MNRTGSSASRHIAGVLLGFTASLVPGLVSIYNPHQYEADPVIQPQAVMPVLIVATVATVVMWLFGRKWSQKTVASLIVLGLVLTVVAIVALMLAASQQMRQAGPLLFVAAVAGNVAIPCVALLSVLITKQSQKEASGGA